MLPFTAEILFSSFAQYNRALWPLPVLAVALALALVLLALRPVRGGDRALGTSLLDELSPFVQRRYLDFESLEDLKAMKRRVDQSLRRPGQYERDVKLGRGGIREIEFWVQAQQLIHGGKDPRLRVRGTLAALERLADAGYVEAGLATSLSRAYRFLRDVEHKIQIAHERQSRESSMTSGTENQNLCSGLAPWNSV